MIMHQITLEAIGCLIIGYCYDFIQLIRSPLESQKIRFYNILKATVVYTSMLVTLIVCISIFSARHEYSILPQAILNKIFTVFDIILTLTVLLVATWALIVTKSVLLSKRGFNKEIQ